MRSFVLGQLTFAICQRRFRPNVVGAADHSDLSDEHLLAVFRLVLGTRRPNAGHARLAPQSRTAGWLLTDLAAGHNQILQCDIVLVGPGTGIFLDPFG